MYFDCKLFDLKINYFNSNSPKSKVGNEGLFVPTDTNTKNIPSNFEQRTANNFHPPEPEVLYYLAIKILQRLKFYNIRRSKYLKISGSIREPGES